MPGDAVAIAEARLGFYGKLPAKGDFLGRRLPRDFVDAWDAWLQEAIAQSREAMGEAWLEAYLTSPLWRFVLGPGLCGADPVAGVVMPSVDRVGRYFPLTIAMPLAACRRPLRLALGNETWFARAEELALSTLEEDADFDSFDTAVGAIGAPDPEAASDVYTLGEPVAVSIAGAEPIAAAAPDLADAVIAAFVPRWSIWWSTGSEAVPARFLIAGGLPPAHGYAALLDGGWERWGWTRQ